MNGLPVSETIRADIEHLGLGRGHRTLVGTRKGVLATAPELQVLATRSDRSFSIQLVNYHLSEERSVTVTVKGRRPGSPLARWELSANDPNGLNSTMASLNQVSVPPQSIVILSGQRNDATA
jgi:hypothetical protein